MTGMMPVFGGDELDLAYNPAEPRNPATGRWYHGTDAVLNPGDLVGPGHSPAWNPWGDIKPRPHVYLTTSPQIAWNEGTRHHVYEVEPTGPLIHDPEYPYDRKRRYMMSKHPLRVVREVTPDGSGLDSTCPDCGCPIELSWRDAWRHELRGARGRWARGDTITGQMESAP
jgi:hypothetical protein